MNRQSFAPVTAASVWFALAVFALVPTTAISQSQSERPQFDAASVRINQSSDRPSTRYDAARVILVKASIKHLVRRAFPLPDYQVVWPDWVAGDRGSLGYDVSVTFPPETTPERLQLMFQEMLATRFRLATHLETRDVRAFEVRASERGPRLRQAVNPAQPTDFPKYSTRIENGVWHLSSQLGGAPSGLTVAGFLEVINGMHILDRPLVDAAGVKGYFDIDLTAPVEVPDNKPAVSELLSALDKQLGLKASLKILPLRMLVIDRLERIPTEN
jgi:uncharacterized protein (TIGR03435 family)